MTIFSKSQTTIEGLDELIKAFNELGEDALPYLKDAANDAGSSVLDRARENVPVLSGQLKSKLKLGKARISSKYPYRVFSKVTFTKDVAYAVPLELGHKLVKNGAVVGGVSERPFMRPAADESEGAAIRTLSEGMNKALEKMGGRK